MTKIYAHKVGAGTVGHPVVESIDFFEFFMATTTLFEEVNGHFPSCKSVGWGNSLSMLSTAII